ncbi:MAG TPA: cytochrome P450 [Streptosporangiaceae bacterium]|nr:cytochrome P450 [Streptosporangiaceae bacterium]
MSGHPVTEAAVAPEINLIDADAYQRGGPPYEQFRWLREHAPVYWHADGGAGGWPGFWAVTRHEDVAAAEEIVRWVSPVNMFRRTATRDTELGGQPIAEGDKVVVFYALANRDEAVFIRPHQFDAGREPNPHVGFGGGGPHFCLGKHLAVLELRVLLRTLTELMPGIRLDGEAARLRSNFINGIKHMPVRFA